MNEATRHANLALERRGYHVILKFGPNQRILKPGDIVERINNSGNPEFGAVEGPVRVLCETTEEDFIEQQRLFGRPTERPAWITDARFWRLVAE